ncbi:hypothetical protein [Muricoccus pecuniae]|uniref:Phosphoenolpyruvate carboxylase n=1 Tax=Muricoccus pecuniae TaxID=693023 RepID=A0A840Y6J0_9PROT|nr:hypothetical protein [Roseomonas pecuniae]MBB5694379.1 phosphoenolpyruvate carboxylase [Roseomonas pecuniae]
MPRAEETQKAVRDAMAKYEAMVLHEKNFDAASQSHKYPHAISAAEVLRMAGIRSRTTLSASYHDTLRRELDVLIDSLKQKCRKGKAAKKVAQETRHRINREDQLAQSIIALQYKLLEQQKKILAQDKELDELRGRETMGATVVNLRRARRASKASDDA